MQTRVEEGRRLSAGAWAGAIRSSAAFAGPSGFKKMVPDTFSRSPGLLSFQSLTLTDKVSCLTPIHVHEKCHCCQAKTTHR